MTREIQSSQETNKANPRPGTLDIIKINGRWGQVIGPSTNNALVKLLDTNEVIDFNYNDFNLVRQWNTAHYLLNVRFDETVPDAEMRNAHYSADSDEPQMKNQITVFGEYQSKS